MKKRLLAEFASRLAEIMEDQGYLAQRGSKLKYDAGKLKQIGKVNSIETARKWLKGEDGGSMPRPEKLLLITQHFGVKMAWLRDGELPKYPNSKTLDTVAEEAGSYIDESAQRMLKEWQHLPPKLREHFLRLITSMNETLRYKATEHEIRL